MKKFCFIFYANKKTQTDVFDNFSQRINSIVHKLIIQTKGIF